MQRDAAGSAGEEWQARAFRGRVSFYDRSEIRDSDQLRDKIDRGGFMRDVYV